MNDMFKELAKVDVSKLSVEEQDVVYCVARNCALNHLKRSDALCSPSETLKYLDSLTFPLEHEVFSVLYMDNQNRSIGYEELFRGTIDAAAIYPREVVKAVLERNAAAVILVHNHPSGSAEPSAADRAITKRLEDALSVIDVRVLDHFVIGHGESVSFAQRGWI